MNISENGLSLIKSFEGCRLTAYKCPAGVWTIGWGHTGGVYQGQTITQAQADEMLVSDLAFYERKVDKYSSYGWNQNEFDALVSFAYNIGSIDQLTANGTRTRAVIANKMLEYNKAAGKVLAGLVRRREAERALFLTPVVTLPGWVMDGYGWWYQREDGTWPENEWAQICGKWYWFNEDGYIYQGQWLEDEGEWYWLDASGAMVTGAQIIDGHLYLFDDSGAMMTGTQVLTLTAGEDGILL